jgi:hypothetical protein
VQPARIPVVIVGDVMNAMRRPNTHRVARRWSVRLILVFAVLAQLFACQAVSASTPGVPAVAIQDIGHGTGHDVVCEAAGPGASSAARPSAPECVPPAGAAAVLSALAVAALVVAARVSAGGMPSWAPRRLVIGRHRLLAVGITRV